MDDFVTSSHDYLGGITLLSILSNYQYVSHFAGTVGLITDSSQVLGSHGAYSSWYPFTESSVLSLATNTLRSLRNVYF